MDKIDEYLLKEYGVIAGACSSIESVKYQIAREVYIKAIDKVCEEIEKYLPLYWAQKSCDPTEFIKSVKKSNENKL